MDGSNLSKWRNGESAPSSEILFSVAEYFDVSVDYLLGRVIPSEFSKEGNFKPNEIQLIHDLQLTNRNTRELALAALYAVLETGKRQQEMLASELSSSQNDPLDETDSHS